MTHVSKLPTLLPTGADAVYVVTGANRGLGLEHVRQFLEKTQAHVIATTRKNPASDASNLRLLADQGKSHRLTVVTLDLSDESSIKVMDVLRPLSSTQEARYVNSAECCRLLLSKLARHVHKASTYY